MTQSELSVKRRTLLTKENRESNTGFLFPCPSSTVEIRLGSIVQGQRSSLQGVIKGTRQSFFVKKKHFHFNVFVKKLKVIQMCGFKQCKIHATFEVDRVIGF